MQQITHTREKNGKKNPPRSWGVGYWLLTLSIKAALFCSLRVIQIGPPQSSLHAKVVVSSFRFIFPLDSFVGQSRSFLTLHFIGTTFLQRLKMKHFSAFLVVALLLVALSSADLTDDITNQLRAYSVRKHDERL